MKPLNSTQRGGSVASLAPQRGRSLTRIAVSILLATSLSATLTSTANAARPTKTYVGCVGRDRSPHPRVAPTRCNTMFSGLSHADTFGTLVNLRWKNWGRSVATATGTEIYFGYDRTPVTARLSRVRTLFGDRGTRAYTRLTVAMR